MTPDEVTDLRRWLDKSEGLADGRPFLGDRRLDAMMDVMLEMAAQVWVLKRRNAVLEGVLAAQGALDPEAIERFTFTPDETAAMRESRAAFVSTIFRSLAELPLAPEASQQEPS